MAISVHNTNRVKPKSSSQQFGEAFSRAAVATSQHLYEKEQKNKQQESVSNFLKNEYGIENAKDIPVEFQMQALKGKQDQAAKLVGKGTPEQQAMRNETWAKWYRGEATPTEISKLPPEDIMQISKEEAQRQKNSLENKTLKDEEDYFSRLMGGNSDDDKQPGMTDNQRPDMTENARPGRTFEDEYGAAPQRAQPGEEGAPRKEPKSKFDYNDPSSWSDKEINKFRSFEGKTPKAKTFAKMAQHEYDRRQEAKKAKAKYQEKVVPLESALETLDRMEKLGKKGNLGIGTKVRGILSPEARRQAAEYERLGKSLISFSSNIPIRNQQEFETLAHDLYDPSISDASREGILAAMRRIIQSSMKQYERPEDEGMEARQPQQPSKQQRPPLTSFMK